MRYGLHALKVGLHAPAAGTSTQRSPAAGQAENKGSSSTFTVTAHNLKICFNWKRAWSSGRRCSRPSGAATITRPTAWSSNIQPRMEVQRSSTAAWWHTAATHHTAYEGAHVRPTRTTKQKQLRVQQLGTTERL
ncbi:hypothetical protein LR48_Vigan03g090700 [Vigna angularis]|uniref:Uncharacterized protein n=1 Tax=Phaseolus angularis TaxID=3914 RepID=A0A0L9U418_PHAAN|nr:hypothetical protein LR48_Vigan03g090700 [Vigna angularis]